MVELHIDLIAESLSIYGSKVNIVDTEVTEFTGFKLLSPNIQTLRKDILYVCEPSALYKLKKSQIRGACFVCRAQAHVFEKYKAYINAIVVDYDTNTNDIANHLADLFSSMNDYKTRLQHAVLLQKGYQPLFDIAKEMFPGCTILMVDSGYNIVCSANTDFENDILPGADPDAVEHIKRLVKLGFYDKTELDQMAEHGYYNQGDKYLNPVISLPPNVCGCPLIVRSYHESSTFFAFVTCYYYYSNPTLVQQRMFKLLSDSLDDYFQITDYYEHVRPFHQQVIADLIENENSSEDFYRDRCLRLHLPQAGDFRLGLIYVSPSNSVRASHCALQLKAWCAVKNYGVFQYGSTEKLINAIKVYNETRRLIRELYELRKADAPKVTGEECLRITLASMAMRKDTFNELLAQFIEEAKQREPITDYRARLMLIGSSCDIPTYLKIFEDKGGLFVADANCYGSRYLYEDVEIDEKDPLAGLARSYLKRPVCPRMLNIHDDILKNILDTAKEFKVDGVVYTKMKNCDLWGGESIFIDDKIREAGLGLLILDREEIVANAGQVGIRAEAFVEMIETGGLE